MYEFLSCQNVCPTVKNISDYLPTPILKERKNISCKNNSLNKNDIHD